MIVLGVSVEVRDQCAVKLACEISTE